MNQTSITIRANFVVGEISPHLFSSFIEHMGSVIYSGIFEPEHPLADEHGVRKDVLALVQALQLGAIRYPGGNFTSGYNWLDTVGPVADRPKKIDLAWQGIEPNQFGLHEFFHWLAQVGADPILTVNLGTKELEDAKNIVEYCNYPAGTYWSDLRRANGAEQPFAVKLWCLGNELDGPWQIGAKSAKEYGRLANEAAKVMKLVDPTIKTILVGSSTPRLASYPEWDRIALEQAYANVDFLALHNYIDKYDEDDLTRPPKQTRADTPTYLAKAGRFERQITEIIATCDYVKGYLRSNKTMYLAFDEWNVHCQPEKAHEKFAFASPVDWCYFTLEDALLFGTLGLSLLRHCDRIKIGCQSLLVNTIPLILTDAMGVAWVNPTYYIMQQLSCLAKGQVLQQLQDGPTYINEEFGQVPYVDSVIVENTDELILFCVNRMSSEQSIEVNHDFDLETDAVHSCLRSSNLFDRNTREAPDTIKLEETSVLQVNHKNQLAVVLPAYSWNVFKIKKHEA